jgi:diphthamide synthase (EF-2-diphthine--ammonia ligase)
MGLPSVFSCVGRDFDSSFLADLPSGVDPCGENGEFHTFVYDGKMFSQPIPIHSCAILERDGFIFAELIRQGHAP